MTHIMLLPFYDSKKKYEIGLDESGRGPMFGRMYASAVVLPKENFFFEKMKDSKKIKSKKKMEEIANYIKENALYYSIQYIENDVIDEINILQADMKAMYLCIQDIYKQMEHPNKEDILCLVDGNYFSLKNVSGVEKEPIITHLQHMTVVHGDDTYASIAAASILAKNARDEYISKLCQQHPDLTLKYGIDTNLGYGTTKHMAGIKQHGITQFHRKTFGICKESILNEV